MKNVTFSQKYEEIGHVEKQVEEVIVKAPPKRPTLHITGSLKNELDWLKEHYEFQPSSELYSSIVNLESIINSLEA